MNSPMPPRIGPELFESPAKPLIHINEDAEQLMRMPGFTVWQAVFTCGQMTGTMALDEYGRQHHIAAAFILGSTPRYLDADANQFALTMAHLTEDAKMLLAMLSDQYPKAQSRLLRVFETDGGIRQGPMGAGTSHN